MEILFQALLCSVHVASAGIACVMTCMYMVVYVYVCLHMYWSVYVCMRVREYVWVYVTLFGVFL